MSHNPEWWAAYPTERDEGPPTSHVGWVVVADGRLYGGRVVWSLMDANDLKRESGGVVHRVVRPNERRVSHG